MYRRHWIMAARRIEGQGHDLPQPSREPTQAFDDYIFVVEAFEGTEPWDTHVGGAGAMCVYRLRCLVHFCRCFRRPALRFALLSTGRPRPATSGRVCLGEA